MTGDDAEIWLVRHGETEWSRDGKHTSSTDLPLTAEGERVALSLRDRLADVSFDVVLTSPMQRARETAVAGRVTGTPRSTRTSWSGDTASTKAAPRAEIREEVPGWTIWSHPAPGGETPDQVTTRLDRVVGRLRDVPDRALVFGHGHALRALDRTVA